MNNYKNLLIIKGFDYKKFLAGQNESDWLIIDLKEIKDRWREILKGSFNNAVAGYSDLNERLLVYFVKALLIFTKSAKKYFIDNQERKEYFSFPKFLFIDTPWFLLEIIFDLFLVVFSWLGLLIFHLLPKTKSQGPASDANLKNIVYLRTDNFRGQQQGGSFSHFRGVVAGFNKLGYQINYIGSGKIEVPNLNFPQNIIPYPKKFNLPEIPDIYYNWRFIPKSFTAVKKEKPLFIYQRHSFLNVCGAILSQLTRIPLVLEYNCSEPWVRQKWGGLLIFKKLCYFMEKFSLQKAQLITVVSTPLQEELVKRGISEKKILVNYNGVDLEEFNPQIDGTAIRKEYRLSREIVIGTVSTFGVWHGTSVLARAVGLIMDNLQNTKYKAHFLFIGDGVERPECERIIKNAGLEKYATFTGLVPYQKIPQYLSVCDIVVTSQIPNTDGTQFFGSPTKLFEYMAMERGIVASNLAQIGEVLEHQKTAWLVKPGDVDDLAQGIIILAKDKNLRNELGNEARRIAAANYSWQRNVEKTIEKFQESLIKS